MRATTLIFAAAVMQLLGPRPAFVRTAYAAAEPTQLAEVVIYGIDGDTDELLRYTFETDEYVRIGKVQTSDGKVVDNTEALTFVPMGPATGMYAIPRDGSLSGWLVRINPLDASAERIADTGVDDVIGMVTVFDPVSGAWRILASTRDQDLYAIDPATGARALVRSLDEEYEGLALRPDGMLLGNTTDELFLIDPATGNETKLGGLPFDKVEALEYAWGDFALTVEIPGVDPLWTKDGALFGFDDDSDTLMVLNPATGQAKGIPCTFATVDCEGLVFTTKLKDLYGAVVVDACD